MTNQYLSKEHLKDLNDRLEYVTVQVRELSKARKDHQNTTLINRDVGIDDLILLRAQFKDEQRKLSIEIAVLDKHLSGA